MNKFHKLDIPVEENNLRILEIIQLLNSNTKNFEAKSLNFSEVKYFRIINKYFF